MAVALAAVMGISLAGCAGSSYSLSSLGSLFQQPESTPSESAPQQGAVQTPVAKVAINSIVGPPDALGRQLQQQFTSALERQRVGVAGKDDRPDYNLRPYILAAKEKGGTKVSYVLDVSEPSGKRVNRFAGEEVVPAGSSQDPWAAITPAVAEAIAAKAVGSFTTWLPAGRPAGGAAAVADATPPPAASAPASSEEAPRPAAKKIAAATTTGSIARDGPLTAVVPSVKGAPGDGSTSLTAAIQRELTGKGVSLTERATPATYRVEGNVTLGAGREGKQAIQIEWVVKDPNGKKLGTVSQKNDIPEGSLDGSWGRVADQAAGAAVQGILKLLPSPSAVN
jgi:hypothetical protein